MEETPIYGNAMRILKFKGYIWGSRSRNDARNDGKTMGRYGTRGEERWELLTFE